MRQTHILIALEQTRTGVRGIMFWIRTYFSNCSVQSETKKEPNWAVSPALLGLYSVNCCWNISTIRDFKICCLLTWSPPFSSHHFPSYLPEGLQFHWVFKQTFALLHSPPVIRHQTNSCKMSNKPIIIGVGITSSSTHRSHVWSCPHCVAPLCCAEATLLFSPLVWSHNQSTESKVDYLS